jgi:cysteinyl-tRNA synthetase
MTRQVEELTPSEPGHLRFYSCGPTVYSYAHIGNFRTFLTADLIVRTAQALGWRVSYASNITDVGHLTADDQADADGEDKMAKALRSKEGEAFVNVWQLAERYETAFREDWRRLNLIEPFVRPRATQHMREQIQMIEDLIAKGHAYETPSGVYFSVESFPDYGKLSGNRDQDSLQRGVREVVQDDTKRHPADFALWKKDEKHLMQWFSPWGWGFPGWHLECSAMAMQYLGETIDLHAGGEDLVFPHHECEIAQSEAVTGKPFCPFWIHTRFLRVDGEKMSKSKGSFYTVRDLVDGEGADPLALRYALIAVPYGKPLNFTRQGLEDGASNVERFRLARAKVQGAAPEPTEPFERIAEEMLAAMCEDLNTSVALARAIEGAKEILRPLTLSEPEKAGGAWFLDRVSDLLGIVPDLDAPKDKEGEPEIEGRPISAWLADRAEAKKAKNFAESDRIRDLIAAAGFEIKDTPTGVEWRRA